MLAPLLAVLALSAAATAAPGNIWSCHPIPGVTAVLHRRQLHGRGLLHAAGRAGLGVRLRLHRGGWTGLPGRAGWGAARERRIRGLPRKFSFTNINSQSGSRCYLKNSRFFKSLTNHFYPGSLCLVPQFTTITTTFTRARCTTPTATTTAFDDWKRVLLCFVNFALFFIKALGILPTSEWLKFRSNQKQSVFDSKQDSFITSSLSLPSRAAEF